MRVLVSGAYGLIGSACLARLHAGGHDVVGCGRSIGTARRRFSYASWIEADFLRLRDAQAWRPLLTNIDAVVNCVGVLQDGLRDDVQQIQLAGTAALFDGCVRAGVKRLVHISALGVDAAGPSAFSRTKAASEAHLKALPIDWVILRPGLVLSPAVYGGTAMLRGIAACPLVVPVIHADARVQVVSIDDLAETVARSLAPATPGKVSWDVAHPQVHTLADIVTAFRFWLGFSPRRVVRVPDAIGKIFARLADAIGWLGWRSPLRTTSLAQLTAGVVGDPAPWMAATGIQPKSLEGMLAARPANVQDRWFARLYLLKPLAIIALAATAIAAGLAEILSLRKIAAGVLAVSSPAFALYVVPGLLSGAAAIVFGAGLLARTTARCSLIALLVLTVLRAAHYCLTSWHLGYMPLAAISAVPLLLAALFTLAILDDR
jgi:uncharacterized protein YbjT (DUF2867 family)